MAASRWQRWWWAACAGRASGLTTGDHLLDLVVPGPLETRTGGFIYDRRIVEQLRARGWRVSVHELAPGLPQPAPAALADLPAGRTVVIDGLALGGMPAIAERECGRLRLIGLVHHPLALETGLTAAQARELHAAERRALAAVAQVVVTSRTTAAALADYGVAPERVTVVNPGTDPAPLAAGSGGAGLNLLCVATLTPRKGHATLVEALAGLQDRSWCLRCAGSAERDADVAAALRRQIAAAGLDGRVVLLGELDETALDGEYARADVFVLASNYEGYGMAFAEAVAHGLPIVATAGGAVAQTVPAAAGLLVPPGDVAALRAALARLIDDSAVRARLREGARRARQGLSTWQEAGDRFAAAVRGAAAR